MISNLLAIDCDAEISRICSILRTQLAFQLSRRGVVIGLSGGIDSSVTAALCARALGSERVYCLLMPESESAESQTSLSLAAEYAAQLGVHWAIEDISELLEASGCYRRRDAAIREILPAYQPNWRFKILPSDPLRNDRLRSFSLVARDPTGQEYCAPLSAKTYLAIVAAMNFKQRSRKMLEYYHADRLNYAVAGTPNRLEYDQGFFVKNGDGAADLKPIAHLYKSQVYAIAGALGIPQSIISREPTTDTYSLPQDQREFYFSLPYQALDLCLYALDHGLAATEIAPQLGLDLETLQRVFKDISAKRRATRYAHLPPLLIRPVAAIEAKPVLQQVPLQSRWAAATSVTEP